ARAVAQRLAVQPVPGRGGAAVLRAGGARTGGAVLRPLQVAPPARAAQDGCGPGGGGMIWRGIRRAARVLAMAGLLAAATTASAQDDGDETARRGELAREIVALIDIERGLEAMLDEATSSLVDGATHLPPAER